MKGHIYLVMAVINPLKEDADAGALSEKIGDPKTIIARSDQDAAIKFALQEESLRQHDGNRLEIIVRPFS